MMRSAIDILPHDDVSAARTHIGQAAGIISHAFSGEDTGREIYDALTAAGEHAEQAAGLLQTAGTGLSRYLSDIGSATTPQRCQSVSAASPGERLPARTLPIWHMAGNAKLLVGLPKLPVAITRAADGELLVTERQAEMLVPKKLQYLYEPQSISAERQVELDLIAERMGVGLGQLADAEIGAAALHNDPAVGPGVKRMWRNDMPLPLMHVLRSAQEQALGQLYAEKVTARGRELLLQYAPDAVPQEPTAAVGELHDVAGGYCGRFGQVHVLSVTPPRYITHEQVDTIENFEDKATVAAHELAHQKFIEAGEGDTTVAGANISSTAPYNQTIATNSQDALQRAYDYAGEFDKTSSEKEKLASRVISAASEIYAYAIEHAVRVGMGMQPIVDGSGHSNLDWDTEDYRSAVEYTLGPDAPLSFAQVKERLLQLDWQHIGNMPQDALQTILDDPKKIFTLPRRA
jgi:hypothetical protein